MPRKVVDVDESVAVEVNVVARSPHVAAYRLWFREPDGAWQTIGDGHTADDVPDAHTFGPVPAGTTFAYWLGIGGNPKTRYRIILTIGQDGKILPGGTCVEEGTTSSDGIADVENEVDLT